MFKKPFMSWLVLFLAIICSLVAVAFSDSILFLTSPTLATRITIWLLVASLVVAAWLLIDTQRTRRALEREYAEDAIRSARELTQERGLVAAEERSRIAREMHDIIAHSLQVIITQADGASYAVAASPELGEKALITIAETARESLSEMRRLLGILRQDDVKEMGPAPGLSAVPELVEELRTAGLDVELISRNDSKVSKSLPKGADLAAYRVVQEALTNIIKHAGPNVKAIVEIDWEDSGLVVAIRDNGRGAGADKNHAATGYGIQGMQERFALYNGTVVAQPKVGGGFVVHAWVPYE